MVWPAIIAGAAMIGAKGMGDRNAAIQAKKARDQQENLSNTEYHRQKEFAQMGLQWKTADAKAAGLHPLAAIGGSGASYSPSSTQVFTDSPPQMYDAIGQAGQNISQAWARSTDPETKEISRLKIAYEQERVDNMGLQNQVLRRDLDAVNTSPSFPSSEADYYNVVPGQVNRDGNQYQDNWNFKVEPDKVTAHSKVPGRTAGHHAMEGLYTDPYGRSLGLVNPQVGDALESDSVKNLKRQMLSGRDWWNSYTSDLQDPKSSAAWRNKLRETRPEAPAGKRYLFNRNMAEWELHDSFEGDTRLFTDKGNQGRNPAWRKQHHSIYDNM